MNLSEILERNARTYPNAIALIERYPSQGLRRQITWKEFDEKANRIANRLMEMGIRKGDRVIHWMMNSIEWLEAYFGIIRTGAWAVPLNFRFTRRDFKYCVDVAGPKAVILDEQFVEKIEGIDDSFSKLRFIVNSRNFHQGMASLENIMAEWNPNRVKVEVGDEDPCGLYFTSGTTGVPKAILLTHKNMECAAITEVVHGLRKPGDIFVILKPLYHTGDWIHWLSSLVLGGMAVIQRDKITPEAIFKAIDEERGTVAMLLVPWLQDILTALESSELNKGDYDLSSWRVVMLGTQHVPPSLVLRWKDQFPEMLYEVNYGLTEASGPGCTHLGIGNEHKLGSIGKAGFNWEARIVDEKGEDVPPGEIGEIVVKGNGVMREYYKNPEKTAETIKDGWLYTGDMAKKDSDGFIWFVERKKDVIICGGENVYPVEVEEVLQRHPKVHDVGVISLPDERLGEMIAAVIDLKPEVVGSTEAGKEIERFCEENLPRYKRPRRIIFDKVLRNPTGKIEKLIMRRKYVG
ncbi:MAG: class I adenylate-forming enzyme family protein [Thermodesulfobacteriota bacterium]